MANNLITTPWYPRPDHDEKTRNFVYLDTLYEDNPKVYNKAAAIFSDVGNNLYGSLWPQLNDLLTLANREQEKEDRLLDLFFNESRANLNPRQIAERIQSFNKIYQFKPIFERNLLKIKQFASGETRQGKIDITTLFDKYLREELKDIEGKTLKQLNEQFFLEVTKRALVRMFNSADDRNDADNEYALRSYQEISSLVEQMSTSDQYIRDICNLYFGSSLADIQKQIKEGHSRRKRKPENLISNQKGLHGSVFEYTNELIYSELGQQSFHSGVSGQKADHIQLLSADIQLELPNADVEDSVREHFIKQYQIFYDKMAQINGQIIEISDKSYDLGSSWFKKNGGFTAQSSVTIGNLEKMLNTYGYNQNRIDDLVYALLNIGPDTLTNDTSIVTRNISSLIGYFLFDDIDMDVGLKIDAIHLFNLNGIYIPLSSFLFAAYEAFFSSGYNFDGFIETTYSPQSVGYQKQETLTEENWIEVRKKKQNQKSLSIHFLKSFAQFVSKYL